MKLKLAALAIALIGIAVPAMAGYPIEGSGKTKAEAADDANRRAQKHADEDRTCITPAKINECVKDPDGGYICTAYVANHLGSCR